MQSCNALFVMLLIPVFERLVYPGIEAAGIRLTPLRKMSAGMLMTSLSFVIIGCLQVKPRMRCGSSELQGFVAIRYGASYTR